ncbi:MAG: hypothetical protein WAQ05_23925 [Rubrivivax sp.]
MMGAVLKMAVAAVVLAAVAVLSNPSAERHRTKIKEAVAERNQLAGWLQLGRLAALASSYHSLGVASYTTVNERWLSFGIFGMVFVAEPKKSD